MSTPFIRAFVPLAATFIVAVGVAVCCPPVSAQADPHPTLPAGAGRDVMIRVCSQCHEPEMVVDQQNDETGWKRLVDEMGGKGADATDAEFDQIVKYLAKAFPAK